MADKRWKGDDATTPNDWSVAANWEPSGVPGTSDNVRIPAGGLAITAGLDQSAVALGDVVVEAGFTGSIGSASGDLKIDPNRFEFAGEGVSYVDIGTAAIDVLVKNTGRGAATGIPALNLIGSAISTLSVTGGDIGLASIHGQSATATTVRMQGGRLKIGEAATITTVNLLAGECTLNCAATTCNVYAGKLKTDEEGAITTITVSGGTAELCSSGTVTTLTLNGGVCDFLKSGKARTVTTLTLNPSASLWIDSNIVTVTNWTLSGSPIKFTTSKV